MSIAVNKSNTNRSTSIKTKDESITPTIFQAFNKLKNEQQKLLEENKRSKVLSQQIAKEQTVLYNRQKQIQFYQSVRQQANVDKQIKKRYQNKQIEELKLRYTTNMMNRQQHKKMIQNVRKSFKEANHQLYQQIKQKKIENQQLIKSQRMKHKQSRIMNRIEANKEKDIRRKSIQHFYQSKSKEHYQNKSKQIQEILHKSEIKHLQYGAVVNKNSRIRENKMNLSRLSSTGKSQRSRQNEVIAAYSKP